MSKPLRKLRLSPFALSNPNGVVSLVLCKLHQCVRNVFAEVVPNARKSTLGSFFTRHIHLYVKWPAAFTNSEATKTNVHHPNACKGRARQNIATSCSAK